MSLLRKAQQCFANQQSYKSLNAFVGSSHDGALSNRQRLDLEAADARRDGGAPKSLIDGQLIAIKDNICTTEEPTTCASAILDGFKSPFPATVVERLKAAGAVVAGKTNLDEFGMGTYSTNSIHGPVRSSFSRDGELLSAGGSSGGSAVAVATDQCDAALGTDSGGSVRFPAACTGIVGFKPSYGLLSRWGVVAYANSLDTVGILARDSTTAKNVFDVLSTHDPHDPTSISPLTRLRISTHLHPRASRLSWSSTPSLRIGVPNEYHTSELQPPILHAWLATLQRLRELGHTIHPISLPSTKLALSAYYILAPAESSSNLAKYDGVRYGNSSSRKREAGDGNVLYSSTRETGLGEEAKRRILLGSFNLSAGARDNYFKQAQKVRRLVQKDFNNVFDARHPLLDLPTDGEGGQGGETQKADVIVAPTAQSLAPKLNELKDLGPTDAYAADVLTVPASLAGLPAVNVPVPLSGADGRRQDELSSVGMQILGQYGDDDLVLDMARNIESGIHE